MRVLRRSPVGAVAVRAVAAVVALLVAIAAHAPLIFAQAPAAQPAPAPSPVLAPNGAPRSVVGRLVRPAPEGDEGVGGVMVTLHRVGPERSGPVDSMRTRADGRYAFRYQPTGSDDALYFVSAVYGGIAYFGTPLRAAAVSGDDAIVTVFDTTSAPIRLRVNGRHIIVSASDPAERRAIVEVFELSNDTSVTRVGGAHDSATFRVPLPAGARDFEAGRQGDIAPGAIAFVRGAVEVYAPFAPGIKQLSFSYSLPREAFPLSLPTGEKTELLEVLLEDSTGSVSGATLKKQGPVTSSGRTFIRWMAEDVPANAVVQVSFSTVPRRPRVPQYAVVAAAIAAALLFALRMVASRRVNRAGDDAPARLDPDRLAQRIAALDASHDRRRLAARALGRDVRADEQVAYDEERARLKAELTDALARRDDRG